MGDEARGLMVDTGRMGDILEAVGDTERAGDTRADSEKVVSEYSLERSTVESESAY